MKINKLLLISPPILTLKYYRDITPLPPLGLGYLASIAEGIGIQTRIIDFLIQDWNNKEDIDSELIKIGSSDKEIENCISEFSPDVAGLSCQFSRQNRIYHKMLSLIKKAKPDCITVAGGAHVSVCPQEILSSPFCDYILIGEAEESFRRLLLALIKNEDIGSIDGLGWKSKGRISINEKKDWITDLDSLPFPAYQLMGLDKYFGLDKSHGQRHKKRFSPIITSRGCPAKCTFCNAKKGWGDKYRFRSVENVLQEMRKLKREYQIQELMFEDDNLTANASRAKDFFCAMVKEKLDFVWDTPNGVGVWSLDEEMLGLMKESGCIRVNFPVESGSQRVIDEIVKKPVNLARVKSLIEYCKKIKLDYGIFLVIGMPGEKVKEMWQSFRFVANRGCFIPNISVATPYPGTELFDTCLKNSYFTREFSLDDLFTMSFMIKTSDWDSCKLRKVIFWGGLYLKFRNLISEPVFIVKTFILYLLRPSRIRNYFKKYTYKK